MAETTIKKMDIHPVVFFTSAFLIISFVVLSLLYVGDIKVIFSAIQNFIATKAGWFYVLVVNVFLAFIVYLLFSKYGKVRLGGAKARPKFSTWAWFAMLFSAGMGIGLLFYSVAEPMYHFMTPPPVGDLPIQAETMQSAKTAMVMTFFHWGLHAWAVYAIVGLALAFFTFNWGLPLTVRSIFYPLLRDKIYGPIGNFIDITAVVATLFGVATSLGLGVKQINAGMDHLFHTGQTQFIQIILIALITAMATASVVLGLDNGIRRLSELNMKFALVILLFVLAVGPTLYILNSFVQNIGNYLQALPKISFWTEAYQETNWQNDWTVFYWAWWIAWSPFVGMFIARISKGRTIREFLLGVLLVPTILTFIWLTVFGNTAMFEQIHGMANIAQAVQDNIAVALFVLLERFPLSQIASFLGVVVVVLFFVTSSDSGSLVIDIITAGGNTNPPVRQRIFWAVLEGVVAAVLLVGGGLVALQTAVITTGLPFALILLVACFSLYKGLHCKKTAARLGKPALDLSEF